MPTLLTATDIGPDEFGQRRHVRRQLALVADPSGAKLEGRALTQLDPRIRTAPPGSIRLDRHATALAWSEVGGDLWMTNFNARSVSRLHTETGTITTFESIANNPGPVVVQGDAVWIGDWDVPQVVRIPAVGSGRPRPIHLPVISHPAGVTSIAADDSGIWAAVPEDRAIFRIDPKTYRAERVPLPYAPWGVAVGDDGIWVAVRKRT